MFALYATLIVLLAVARFVLGRRAAALERKFTKVAIETDELAREPRKPGNSAKPDPYAVARAAYMLGQAVEKRERVETKYLAWQRRAEGVGAALRGVLGFQGKKLPYAVGVLDVLLVLGTLDYLGYRDQISAQALVEFVSALVKRA